MQNRFSAKDFVLFALMAIVLCTVGLNMCQSDRLWDRNEEAIKRAMTMEGQLGRLDSAITGVEGKLKNLNESVTGRVDPALAGIEGKLQQIEKAIGEGVNVRGTVPAGSGGAQSSGSSGNAGQQSSGAAPQNTTVLAGDAWARPDVKIVRFPTFTLKHKPDGIAGSVQGGEVTEVWEAQTKTLAPFISPDVYSRRIQELVLDSLADYDPETLEARGVLADGWQVDPEGMWLRAHLRPGVRFSDGKPLTSEDIRWTFHEYIMNSQIDAERTRSILADSIDRVEVIDPRTVEFVFKQRLFTNVTNALGMFVLPKHMYSTLSPAQINKSTGLLLGSGPFRIPNFDPNRQWTPPADIVLERNEQYWGEKPVLASLRYKAINEEIARLNTFFSGGAEIITPAAPQFVAKQEDPEWQKRATFLNWVNMRSGYSFIAWNCGERNGKLTPFHDKRVRLAMTQSFDREKMIRDISMGMSVVAKGNMPLASPGSNKEIKPWPFDPAKAKALLKEAGWEDRNNDGLLEDKLGNVFAFEFTYPSGSEIGDRRARFIQDSFTAMGMKVVLKPVEWAVFQDVLKTRDFDAVTLGWGASAPESDPRQIFHSDSIKNQGDNFAQWANADADRLIDAGRREIDTDKRMKIWQQFEAVLHEEQPYTFMTVPPWLRFVSNKVGNVHKYPKGLEPSEYIRLDGSVAPSPGN